MRPCGTEFPSDGAGRHSLCCSVLQCATVCYSVVQLQCAVLARVRGGLRAYGAEFPIDIACRHSVLQLVHCISLYGRCSVLQCSAMCCVSASSCTLAPHGTEFRSDGSGRHFVCCRVVHCVAACCSVLQLLEENN